MTGKWPAKGGSAFVLLLDVQFVMVASAVLWTYRMLETCCFELGLTAEAAKWRELDRKYNGR